MPVDNTSEALATGGVDVGALLWRPERLEGGWIRRQREYLPDEAILDPEQQHLVEIESPAAPLARSPVERGRPVLTREDVDEPGAVRAVGLLRQSPEEAEDLLRAAVDAGHQALTGHRPDRLGREHAAELQAFLARKRVEDPADERLVASRAHASLPSARSGSRRDGAAPR